MKFALDVDKRFVLVANNGGWDLIVDGEMVHYCRHPADALAYMADEMMTCDTSEGVVNVLRALGRVEDAVSRAADIVNFHETAVVVARVLKHDNIRDASLELAGCRTTQELRAMPECKLMVAQTKAILAAAEPMRKSH
jgi:hypothetical protein